MQRQGTATVATTTTNGAHALGAIKAASGATFRLAGGSPTPTPKRTLGHQWLWLVRGRGTANICLQVE